MLDKIVEKKDDIYSLITGFDMVNEEDYNDPIDTFIEQIIETREKLGDKF